MNTLPHRLFCVHDTKPPNSNIKITNIWIQNVMDNDNNKADLYNISYGTLFIYQYILHK